MTTIPITPGAKVPDWLITWTGPRGESLNLAADHSLGS
jgi:hypothetical protein